MLYVRIGVDKNVLSLSLTNLSLKDVLITVFVLERMGVEKKNVSLKI